jgi:peptide/nickel transport system permease protein
MRSPSRALLRSGEFMTGIAIVGLWVVCALLGQHFAPYDPFADDILNALSAPSRQHWFGTDQLGRDVFSRVLVGSRDILEVAPLATALGVGLGLLLGLASGYFRGALDEIIGRITDALLALPLVITASLRR